MSRALATWACNVAALFAADALIGGVHFSGPWKVVLAGAVFGIVNWLVKPVVTILALPAIILTLGVALFFVNLLMLVIAAWVTPGFTIDGFWPAVGATIVVWAVNAVLHSLLAAGDGIGRRRPSR